MERLSVNLAWIFVVHYETLWDVIKNGPAKTCRVYWEIVSSLSHSNVFVRFAEKFLPGLLTRNNHATPEYLPCFLSPQHCESCHGSFSLLGFVCQESERRVCGQSPARPQDLTISTLCVHLPFSFIVASRSQQAWVLSPRSLTLEICVVIVTDPCSMSPFLKWKNSTYLMGLSLGLKKVCTQEAYNSAYHRASKQFVYTHSRLC